MVYSLHRFGCMFDEYFLYGYENLNAAGRDSFITDKLRWEYYQRVNEPVANEIFNDKKKAYDHFSRYYKRELISVSKEKDRNTFVNFANRHSKFILKPYNGSGGRGVRIVQCNSEAEINQCFEDILSMNGGAVCEELIRQCPKMASLHPSSVNTVRVPTIRDKDGVHLFHPLLRTGAGGGIIDNATGGGIFALVDPKTGIIKTEAKDEKGHTFLVHPDSNVVFPGFQLPEWDEAIELVKSLASVVEDNHYVGWDIAHTDSGWVMVEGNPRGQLIMMQLFCRTGFKEEFEQHIKNIR